jgi:hypothetical protein
LVSHNKGRVHIQGVWKQGAENGIFGDKREEVTGDCRKISLLFVKVNTSRKI